MSINFGVGSSTSLGDCGESPTLASETPPMLDDVGDLAMEIVESPIPNVTNAAKPPKPKSNLKPKPNPKRKQRSDVWNHYKVELDGNGSKTCTCVYCGHKYLKVTSRSGTGNMLRHLENCPRKNSKDVGVILNEVKSKFDPDHFRELLCSAIVVHDLPFRFVEYERIIACFEYLKWDIKLVTRNTVKADILKIYEKQKIVVKSKLGKIPGSLSLTSYCWSSIWLYFTYMSLH